MRRIFAALMLPPLTLFLSAAPAPSSVQAQARQVVPVRAQAPARAASSRGRPQQPLAATRDSAERLARAREERARIEKAQALHTLAGWGRELRQGRKDKPRLSSVAESLRAEAQRKKPEWRPERRAGTSPMRRMKATPRSPRTEAPNAWRDATERDLKSGQAGSASPVDTKPRAKCRDGSRCAGRGGSRMPTRMPKAVRQPRAAAPVAPAGRVTFTSVAPRSRWPEDAPLPAQAVDDDTPLPVTPASIVPTVDAPSDHPLIIEKANELGRDPIRIYNFVHDTILTELYAGSKKGAVGTLREGAGNDVDQASLLIALYRASGIPARYETGNVAFTPAQANQYAGVEELSVAAALLSSAGIPNSFYFLGTGQGIGLQVEHTWVRAQVPDLAYRGIGRPGGDLSWVHLAPSIKLYAARSAVDLRDSVTFDFDAYLSHQQALTPLEVYEAQLREYVRASAVKCPTLDDAQKLRRIEPGELELLPSELPVRRVSTLAAFAEVPASERHTVRFQAQTSQGAAQLTYSAPMASLWGKSVTLVYAPASAADASIIAQYGGIEHTPAFKVKLRATLKVDGLTVASGAAETPGLDQHMLVDMTSPATGQQRVEHPLIVSGVYAFVLDPGLVPSDLLSERAARYPALSGDDLEAEKLHVAALMYFHEYGRARAQIAGLHWHRVYKEVEEAVAMVTPRVEELNGVPLAVPRDYFTFDAPGLRFGDFSIDGNHLRSVRLSKLIGYHSSVLEHRMGQRFRGPKSFSAVSLLQYANDNQVPVVTFTQGTLDEALSQISWPLDREERLRDFANLGYTVQAPVFGMNDPDLGQLFGFIAIDPSTGLGGYIVGTLRSETHGANAQNNPSSSGGPGCKSCGEVGSPVHLLSGNLSLSWTDLTLPARGMPLVFTRVYNTRLGWTHNYREKLTVQPDGTLQWYDSQGLTWVFTAGTSSGEWLPPPKLFQRIVSVSGGYEMRFKDGTVHRFDTAGRLMAYEDLNGHEINLQYDAAGRLSLVTADAGQGFSFAYDALNRLQSVSDTAGRAVSFGYDAANITSATDVLGHVRHYTYDVFGRMHTRSDARGNVYSYEYDDVGRIVRLEDPLGAADTYAYDYANRRTMHVDRRGEALIFELNDLAKIVQRIDPLGNEQVMTWDSKGNKTSERDARGNLTSMTYDGDGNLLTRTEPTGATTTYSYGAHARLLTVTDEESNTTTNTYDAHGNLESTTDALNHVTAYTYTPDGLPATITRPGGAVTELGYDDFGNVTTVVDAAGIITSMTHDAAGHLLTTTDPNGTRTMTVNAAGQLLTMQDALGALSRFEYDPDGNRTLVVDPEQRSAVFTYDALSRVVLTTDALGQVTRNEYDAEGNVVAVTDGRGFRSTRSYDAIGRLVETCDALGHCTRMAYCAELSGVVSDLVDALGNRTHVECDVLGRESHRVDPLGNTTQTTYDVLGRRKSVKDAAGNTTTFEYDALGRLTSVTDALLGTTTYGYDERGNRTSVTDANSHTTTFEYDLADRLIRETTPIGTQTEYTYDGAGNRATKTDGKEQLTTFEYDAGRRLQVIGYADGTSAGFDNDVHGQRTLESNQDSTRNLAYDALHRLKRVDDVETGRTIDYTYDASGNRASMRVSPDDETTSYAWDARGLLIRMTDPEGGNYHFGYDELGRRISTTYPNGMTLSTAYDAASRVLSMVYRKPNGAVIESFTYTYDSRGNRTAKMFADGTAEQYGYDALSRLVRASYPSGREVHYRYDAVGNRLEMTEGTSGGPAASCANDQDCDGVSDSLDNCPAIANANQLDSDKSQNIVNVPGASAIWRFEETSGTNVVDTMGTNPGTLVGGVTRVTLGKSGRALSFDGVDDRVTTPLNIDRSNTTAGVMFEAWVYPTSLSSGRHHVLSTDNGGYDWSLLREGGTWYVFTGEDSRSTGVTVDLNQWQHVAAVFTPGVGVRFYKNGVAALVPFLAYDTSDANINIGRNPSFGEYFAGQIDEVAVYPRPLTAAEIKQHYDTGLVGDSMGDVCDPCPTSGDGACVPTTCLDQDGDGYGKQGASACSGGVKNFDCDDANPAVHPGVTDSCDNVDNDCDGRKDEGCLSGALTTTYQYNDFNQLLSATGPGGVTTFAYDDNGNQISKVEPGGTTLYTWDARDRLVEVQSSSGISRYGYDANNLRVSLQDEAGSRRILLDAMEELSEYVGSARATRFQYDPTNIDGLLSQRTGTATTYVLSDALSSVYQLVDSAQAIMVRYMYDTHGVRKLTAGTDLTRVGFTGRDHEAGSSGMVYSRARYLDTDHGRWMSADPSGMSDSPNRYWYVRSSPTNYIDPSGERAIVFVGSTVPVTVYRNGYFSNPANAIESRDVDPMSARGEFLSMLQKAQMLPASELATAQFVKISARYEVRANLFTLLQQANTSESLYIVYVGHSNSESRRYPATMLSPGLTIGEYVTEIYEGLGADHPGAFVNFAACATGVASPQSEAQTANRLAADAMRTPSIGVYGAGQFAAEYSAAEPGFRNLNLFTRDASTLSVAFPLPPHQ
jgi:RHS repeat-associated protein